MSLPLFPQPPSPRGGEGGLEGLTVLVTRPAKQAAGLAEPLEARGATVVLLPAIEIAPPEDQEFFDSALYDVDRFGWIVFTSVNGVEAFRARFDALGLQGPELRGIRLVAVGPATAAAMERLLRKPDVVPSEYVSDAIADAMGDVRGQWVLLPRADIAREEIVETLQARGAFAEPVAAYRIVRPLVDTALPEHCPDWIALTSSSGVRGTRDALAAAGRESWMREARLACVGPITAATVRELGYEVAAMAEESTMAGLVEAIVGASEAPSSRLREEGARDGERPADGSLLSVGTTPSPTVPPFARDKEGSPLTAFAPRLQGEPSPEETYA